MSGFSESNYAFTPFAPEQPVTSYEMVAKFTSGDFSTSQQGILANGAENMTCPQIVLNEDENDAFALYFAHSTSSSWIAAGQVIIQPNTPYWAKMVWDGENVTSYYKTSESAEYIQVGTAPATSVYWTEKVSIGNDGGTLPLQNGSIDLNGCYININGSRWWSGMSNGVKYSTEDYTDYDYVINTTDETFRLPVKTKTPSGKAVVGNGKALTLLNNSTEYGLSGFSSTNYLTAYSGFVNRDVGGTGSNGSIMPTGIRAIGVTTDPENSGLELSDGDLYLYYYVGETVQNANLINAGRIEEKLVGKVDYANTQWAVNACMPDYSAGVEVAQLYTANSSYTAPCDGVIVFNAFKASSTLELYINGVASGYVLPAEPQWASNRNSATIPLSKGDVIYSSVSAASSSSRRSMFYPLKGAK